MTLSAFPKMKALRPSATNISDKTFRDFSGGLKVSENQTALNSKYAAKLINMFVDDDNSQIVRFGTKKFAETSTDIINTIYYKQNIICVLSNGSIEKIDSTGNVAIIWNGFIASGLDGSPSGWSHNVTQADFTEFRDKLIIVNGQDRPLIIGENFVVQYLSDPSSGSNINTPIARFITTVSNYVVMAGIPSEADTIFISAAGTSGVYIGDPEPNDAISFNVAAYTGQSTGNIVSVGSFKNFLIVFFENYSISILLGNYDEANNHTPNVVDTYPSLGTINNNCIISTDSDLLFPSSSGIYTATKTLLSETLATNDISSDLGDDYSNALGRIRIDRKKSFVVNDILSKTIFFVFHLEDGSIESWAMKYRGNFKKVAWSQIHGWNFTSASVSEKGRVFLSIGNEIYQYGNSVFTNENYHADLITDDYEGNPIDFDWEFPWVDNGNRIKTKLLKKITFDTTGNGAFDLQCFVNHYYLDKDGNYDPAAEMNFVAGSSGGYGNNIEGYGDGGFGGGRRANDERFYGFPLKFKILKMRIHGSTKLPIRFTSISMIYVRGNYN